MTVCCTTGCEYLCVVCLYNYDEFEYIWWVFRYRVRDGIMLTVIYVSCVRIRVIGWNTGCWYVCIMGCGTCGR